MRGRHSVTIGFIVSAILWLSACGGAPTQPAQPTTIPVSPTRAIDVPTFSFTQPTAAPQVATAAAQQNATQTAASADPEAIERGRARYEALTCTECHGANGEGTERGAALVGYPGSLDDFITFMRSGGSLGVSHQYASNRLSETGARNLYAYLKSLS